MNDTLAFRPLAEAVSARRETQRHLDCLSRQIAARAGRQAITVKVRSRARRRSGPRHYHRELVERLVFERWGELEGLSSRLAAQEQVIDELDHCDHPLAQSSPGRSVQSQCGGWRVSNYRAALMSASVANLAMLSLHGLLLMLDPCRTALLFAAV